MKPDVSPTSSLVKRLLWFVALWLTSVTALAVVAIGIRWVLRP